jgi:hypothetical protein
MDSRLRGNDREGRSLQAIILLEAQDSAALPVRQALALENTGAHAVVNEP